MNNVSEELKKYKENFQRELYNILSYWEKYSREKDNKSFYGAVDLNGKPITTEKKSCVLNSRILWTFSAALLMNNKPAYSAMAELAYNVLESHFHDKEFGGYFMDVSPVNIPQNKTKHTYVQAFVLYALCKYYEYNSDKKILERIKDLFQLLEQKTKDKNAAGYLEAFTYDWNLIEENRMADNNEPKTMNTHLHLLEAYSALFKVWRDEQVKKRLTELLNIFTNKIIRKDGHLGIFFNNDFEENQSSKGICSFGHEIEASWLLYEAAEILDDEIIKQKLIPVCIKMADNVEREGVDKDGGLFLESTRYGSHIRTNKHWWLQAENLVGFMNAYQLTNDNKYWETVKLAWNFINKNLIDHQRGEWYVKLNRLGVPYLIEPEDDPSPYYKNDRKIDPWKAPYHNSRAMMELIKRIEILTNKNL